MGKADQWDEPIRRQRNTSQVEQSNPSRHEQAMPIDPSTNFSELSVFGYVLERDLDLILLEELHVSPSFRAWLFENVLGQNHSYAEFVGAWRSMSNEFGESDIVAIAKDQKNGRSIALMIENKIAAPFQPNQPERYRIRGERGKELGHWQDFRTCIIAPGDYLKGVPESDFDHAMSYQAIADWLSLDRSDTRSAFKARLLREAIEAAKRGLVVDPVTTIFFQQYASLCVREFPKLNIKPVSAKGADGTFQHFTDAQGIPEGIRIIHKCARGCVDLTIPNSTKATLQAACRSLLETDMAIAKTGKSAAIRLSVPPLDHRGSFADQANEVKICLRAAERLRAFAEKNASRLAEVN